MDKLVKEKKEAFFNNILDVANQYVKMLTEKIADEKNHSGMEFQEINDGIRILNHFAGMIKRSD